MNEGGPGERESKEKGQEREKVKNDKVRKGTLYILSILFDIVYFTLIS